MRWQLTRYIEMLNNFVKEGAIVPAVCFNIAIEIPSGPLDFEISRESSRWCTSSSVHSSDSSIGLLWGWMHLGVNGGKTV